MADHQNRIKNGKQQRKRFALFSHFQSNALGGFLYSGTRESAATVKIISSVDHESGYCVC